MPGQPEEGKAEGEEAHCQTEAAGVAGQEGNPCNPSGEKPGVRKHGEAQGDEQGARNQCVAIIQPSVCERLWCSSIHGRHRSTLHAVAVVI
jgi:hypothetical protein